MPSARPLTIPICSSVAVVGDGEAETGPLAGSWQGMCFLNPGARRRGAADSASQRLQDRQADGPGPRRPMRRCEADGGQWLRGALRRDGDDPTARAPDFAATLDACYDTIRAIQTRGARQRRAGATALAGDRAAHAQGLDRSSGGGRHARRRHLSRASGAARQGAERTRRTWRSSKRGCAAIEPETLFDESGRLVPELAALAPQRRPPHGRQSARQWRQAAGRPEPARIATTRVPIEQPGGSWSKIRARSGPCCAMSSRSTRSRQLPPLLPG